MKSVMTSGSPIEAPRQATPDQRHRDMLRDFGAAHYADIRASYARNAYFHRYLNRIISRQIPPGASVLDVGSAMAICWRNCGRKSVSELI